LKKGFDFAFVFDDFLLLLSFFLRISSQLHTNQKTPQR